MTWWWSWQKVPRKDARKFPTKGGRKKGGKRGEKKSAGTSREERFSPCFRCISKEKPKKRGTDVVRKPNTHGSEAVAAKITQPCGKSGRVETSKEGFPPPLPTWSLNGEGEQKVPHRSSSWLQHALPVGTNETQPRRRCKRNGARRGRGWMIGASNLGRLNPGSPAPEKGLNSTERKEGRKRTTSLGRDRIASVVRQHRIRIWPVRQVLLDGVSNKG